MITGKDNMTEHAVKSPHSMVSLKLLLNCDNATGKVVISVEFVTINGHIKLFQLDTKVKIASVEITGIASGKITLQNI